MNADITEYAGLLLFLISKFGIKVWEQSLITKVSCWKGNALEFLLEDWTSVTGDPVKSLDSRLVGEPGVRMHCPDDYHKT